MSSRPSSAAEKPGAVKRFFSKYITGWYYRMFSADSRIESASSAAAPVGTRATRVKDKGKSAARERPIPSVGQIGRDEVEAVLREGNNDMESAPSMGPEHQHLHHTVQSAHTDIVMHVRTIEGRIAKLDERKAGLLREKHAAGLVLKNAAATPRERTNATAKINKCKTQLLSTIKERMSQERRLEKQRKALDSIQKQAEDTEDLRIQAQGIRALQASTQIRQHEISSIMGDVDDIRDIAADCKDITDDSNEIRKAYEDLLSSTSMSGGDSVEQILDDADLMAMLEDEEADMFPELGEEGGIEENGVAAPASSSSSSAVSAVPAVPESSRDAIAE